MSLEILQIVFDVAESIRDNYISSALASTTVIANNKRTSNTSTSTSTSTNTNNSKPDLPSVRDILCTSTSTSTSESESSDLSSDSTSSHPYFSPHIVRALLCSLASSWDRARLLASGILESLARHAYVASASTTTTTTTTTSANASDSYNANASTSTSTSGASNLNLTNSLSRLKFDVGFPNVGFPGFNSKETLDELASCGVRMSCSSKGRESEAGALLLQLLYRVYVI